MINGIRLICRIKEKRAKFQIYDLLWYKVQHMEQPAIGHSHMAPQPIPNMFLWRRLHSLAGVWLVLFLILHLLTNSQAALFVGDDGQGFIEGADSLEHIPYVRAVEVLLLAVPFAIHILFGLHRLFMAESNSFPTDGSKPALPQYPRNRAFTWMRWTSWLLLLGVILHVVHMRFIDYPWNVEKDGQKYYLAILGVDSGLYTVSERLHVTLYDAKHIAELSKDNPKLPPISKSKSEVSFFHGPKDETFDEAKLKQLQLLQDQRDQQHWVEALQRHPVDDHHVIAVAKNFGSASLLILRDTFKSPLMVVLYSIFVLVTCYHAFNGLWTSLITWGITLTARSQRLAFYLSTALMFLVAFLGLAAAIGTYWVNLRS